MEPFTPFPKLPPELRLRIWRFAGPSPRIVELTWNSKARSVVSRTVPPALLHSCHESRRELIKTYKELQFGNCTQIILIDFDKDTLFFGEGCKCMVPSGKSDPWIMQNRKVIKDISSSTCLRDNLQVAAFDCAFLLAMDDTNYFTSALGMVGSLTTLVRAMLVSEVVEYTPRRYVKDGLGRKFKDIVAGRPQMKCIELLADLSLVVDSCELVVEWEK